jgi:hypothetical protein
MPSFSSFPSKGVTEYPLRKASIRPEKNAFRVFRVVSSPFRGTPVLLTRKARKAPGRFLADAPPSNWTSCSSRVGDDSSIGEDSRATLPAAKRSAEAEVHIRETAANARDVRRSSSAPPFPRPCSSTKLRSVATGANAIVKPPRQSRAGLLPDTAVTVHANRSRRVS